VFYVLMEGLSERRRKTKPAGAAEPTTGPARAAE
jgi:hypothetical protein